MVPQPPTSVLNGVNETRNEHDDEPRDRRSDQGNSLARLAGISVLSLAGCSWVWRNAMHGRVVQSSSSNFVSGQACIVDAISES